MLLTKKVKAAVLVYALLMAALFSLFLQFYLNRVLAMERQQQAQLQASQAYMMASWTADLARDRSGAISYNLGQATYQKEDGEIQITVRLNKGSVYDYRLAVPKTYQEESQEVSKEIEKSARQE